ncbi:hypothetical protein NNC19_18190 [Clostridium sp. SHJSY1]|uniref:hypothetical protein n=1 Tax=Clostridium sp. SHJSY1 TaxID=2942483 RepID=UPI002875CE22|nr:hypothetical protein [Clostridium sp. SHJSY1]MDS0527623.1 hypothetical protein [Clostridium sp. SHJSY1]
MKLKRKILSLILTLLVCMYFTGCSGGSYVTKLSWENSRKSYMKMLYSSFSGNKYTELKLQSGDILELNIDVKTESGSLEVSVTDEDNNKIYSTENPEKTIEEKINISKDGKYKIKVEGEHKGSFKVSWNIEKN